MSDNPIDKVERYYINKRIDTLEVYLKEVYSEIREDLKADTSEIKEMLKAHLGHCNEDMERANIRLRRLESFKNKAVGAVALFLALVTLWQIVSYI